MKITCHSCSAKYTVSDDKVQGKTVKIKCRKCGATILVGPGGVTGGAHGDGANGSAVEAHSVSAGDVGGGTSFMVNVAEGDQRTMSLEEIVEAYNTETINAETYVWQEGMDDWQTLGENEAIVAALHAAPQEAPMASGDAYDAAQGGFGGGAASPSPAYAAADPYAAPDPYAATARAVVAPEPSPRPAARRDPARRSQDLFGGGMGGGGLGGGMGMQAGPAADAGGSSTGQRDENSVLFSLSALTSSASTSSGPKTTATREDSGLIDLKALAASASAAAPGGVAGAPQNLVPDTAAVFPLGAPPIAAAQPPPSMGGISIPEAPASKSKAPIFIGVAVAIAAMVGVFFVVQGGGQEETKPATATEATAAPAPPPPTAAPEPTAAPTATAVAAPTASASAAPVAAGGKWTPPPGYKPPPAGAVKPPPGGAGTKPPPPPPAAGGGNSCTAKCGGNLMCAMQCSTKK